MKNVKKVLSGVLCALIAMLAPGIGAYQAAAQDMNVRAEVPSGVAMPLMPTSIGLQMQNFGMDSAHNFLDASFSKGENNLIEALPQNAAKVVVNASQSAETKSAPELPAEKSLSAPKRLGASIQRTAKSFAVKFNQIHAAVSQKVSASISDKTRGLTSLFDGSKLAPAYAKTRASSFNFAARKKFVLGNYLSQEAGSASNGSNQAEPPAPSRDNGSFMDRLRQIPGVETTDLTGPRIMTIGINAAYPVAAIEAEVRAKVPELSSVFVKIVYVDAANPGKIIATDDLAPSLNAPQPQMPDNPAPKKRDLSWSRFFAGISGAAVDAIVAAAGIIPLALYYAPQAYWYGYQTIWDDKNIGLRYKLGGSALLVPLVPLVALAAPLIGLIYGIGKGFTKASSEGLIPALRDSVNIIRDIKDYLQKGKKYAQEGIQREKTEPRPTQVKDLPLAALAKGLTGSLAALLSFPVPCFFLILAQSNRVFYYGLRSLWKSETLGFRYKLAISLLFPISYILLNALALPGTAIAAIVGGFMKGRELGPIAAFKEGWEDVKRLNQMINAGISGLKQGGIPGVGYPKEANANGAVNHGKILAADNLVSPASGLKTSPAPKSVVNLSADSVDDAIRDLLSNSGESVNLKFVFNASWPFRGSARGEVGYYCDTHGLHYALQEYKFFGGSKFVMSVSGTRKELLGFFKEIFTSNYDRISGDNLGGLI